MIRIACIPYAMLCYPFFVCLFRQNDLNDNIITYNAINKTLQRGIKYKKQTFSFYLKSAWRWFTMLSMLFRESTFNFHINFRTLVSKYYRGYRKRVTNNDLIYIEMDEWMSY